MNTYTIKPDMKSETVQAELDKTHGPGTAKIVRIDWAAGIAYYELVAPAGGAGSAVVIYLWRRGPAGAAQDVARGMVNVAAGAAKGVAQGVGIPDTDRTKCQKALAEGRYWDASFDCPAADFVRGIFGGSSSKPPAAADVAARVVSNAENFDTNPYEWNYN